VTIDSEIGCGTTIQIYLPRAPQRASDADEPNERNELDAGLPSRILVVDDNSAVRTITAIMLRTLGHDAIEAAGGQDALDLLEQDPQFDLLIVDLAMPNMHGDEFAARARELISDVPILFVTGYAEPGRVRPRPEGEILKKPFRRVQLAAKLRYVLGGATRRNRARATGDGRY
jgi:CheY-like chemotaxis protein